MNFKMKMFKTEEPERLEIMQALLSLRKEGISKEDRIFLVNSELEKSAWDPDELKETPLGDDDDDE